MNNLVSIIVPIYNTREYLEKCLNSIVQQTYKHYEVIMIDDGSTDGSEEIYTKYLEDSRFSVIKNSNQGLSFSRQLGFNLSKGEYFITIDSDDFISPNFLELMVNRIIKDQSDICVCSKIIYKNEKHYFDLERIEKNEVFQVTNINLINNYEELVRRFHMSDSWNKIYRKSFILKTGVVFDLDRKYNGTDLLFNHLIILYNPRISTLNQELYFYRIRSNSQVRRKNRKLLEGFLIIIEKIYNEAKNIKLDDDFKGQISLLFKTFLKAGLMDLYKEGNLKLSSLKLVLAESRIFERRLKINTYKIRQKTLSMKIFNFLYNFKLNTLLWLYISIIFKINNNRT